MQTTLRFSAIVAAVTLALSAGVQGQGPDRGPLPTPETAPEILARSPRHGEWMNVRSGLETVRTYIVHPVRKDRGPCVIVVAEGFDDYARAIGDRLALEGFTALVADLSTDSALLGRKPTPASAGQGLRALKPRDLTARMQSVWDYATRLPAVNEKVATVALGWGAVPAIEYAEAQAKIAATVIFFGKQPATADLANIKSPVLGFYASSDERTPAGLALVQQNWSRAIEFLKQQTQ